jgi:hypothetical protein
MFNPLCTAKVWFPKYVPSLITSLHHKAIEDISPINASPKKKYALLNPCIVNTPVVVKVNRDNEL